MSQAEGAERGTEAPTARAFALDRLQDGETVKASKLADEYGCTNAHMREVCREFRKSYRLDRVGRGEYRLVDGSKSPEIRWPIHPEIKK